MRHVNLSVSNIVESGIPLVIPDSLATRLLSIVGRERLFSELKFRGLRGSV